MHARAPNVRSTFCRSSLLFSPLPFRSSHHLLLAENLGGILKPLSSPRTANRQMPVQTRSRSKGFLTQNKARVTTTAAHKVPGTPDKRTKKTRTDALGNGKGRERPSSVSRSRKRKLLESSVDVDDGLREKARNIGEQLRSLYPDPAIPLTHKSDFQLLVTVMLSAQSTDKKVNEHSPALFALAPDAKSMAELEVPVIEKQIKQIGLAPTKAKNLSKMSKILMEKHGGNVPNTFEALEELPGVGHKTASVVMVQAFGLPAFPVDTHIHRLAERWGLSNGKSVEQTEADLKALFPESEWEHCPARNHQPKTCPICSWAAKGKKRK